MRLQSSVFSFLFAGLVTATGFDCAHINLDGIKYDLSPLGGVHSLYHIEETEDYVVNTTYVLNICNILKGAAIRGNLKCGTSKNICGFEYRDAVDGSDSETKAFPIAGLDHLGHGAKDPEITRLKQLDPDREGLRVRLGGGQYLDDKKTKKDAGAVIEFQCDPTRSGLEGISTEEDTAEEQLRAKEDGDESGDKSRSLRFQSFGPADNESYVLKLDWKTRYACDDYLSSKKGGSSNHWGFFTWFIVILFLCISAYLIFGSWLNYNRYGARGWDLLPHGDTIRDVPYILQDWFRRVVNTLQGTGSRGGYSAV
ncbi:autophagy-related protein 27 [Aspergillus ruber CBS 135680]|uniref:Autophagy-related protein 27 n=1 Tax=Aspergillus ruber (strain CBS 135680) TaxID=1388766 RepID=A0A017SRU9_ASPRC|nr:putative autophagy protein Atg27 [Aspergillus ruber CBS 135680]EYE98995.1 putative autophagy protein Atg27 [Aspergillus ruber CBS 135680]